jgi:hypothetical protein
MKNKILFHMLGNYFAMKVAQSRLIINHRLLLQLIWRRIEGACVVLQ